MRLFLLPQSILRIGLVLGVILGFSTPLLTLAQDATPAAGMQEAPAPLAPGSVQITVYGNDGIPLSGSFAVSDSAGVYQEVWASGGVATAWNVAAGTATVSQLTGTIDYTPDYSPRYVEIPAGGTGSASYTNAFLDTDLDGIGNSVDVCAAGNDRADTDLDTIADACDTTPNGDTDGDGIDNLSDPTPNGELPTAVPTQPVAGPTVAASPTATVAPESDVAVEVSEAVVVVEDAPVTCQDAQAVSPTIASDLADYPPGGLVKLSSAGWVPGQVVEILVEDDGIADAEQGEWNHKTTVTADGTGNFTYSFNIAPWYVADYTVVATGECSRAETSFTDSVTGTGCIPVPNTSDFITPTNSFAVFRCSASSNPIKLGVAVSAQNPGWEWGYTYIEVDSKTKIETTAPVLPPQFGWYTNSLNVDSSSGGSASGNIKEVYVFLRPQSTNLMGGSEGKITVSIQSPSGGVASAADLTAYRLPTATDFTLSCLPATLAVELNNTDTVTCTIRSTTLATGAAVTLAAPVITNIPANWSSGTVMISPGNTVTKSEGVATLFTFTIPLKPTSCSAATGGIRVSASLTFRNQTIALTPADPASTISLKPSGALSVSVDSLKTAMTWDQPYSLTGYPLNAGSLTYSITSPGCGGWNVQVSASNFVRTGGGDPIPASNLTLTQAQAPAPATTGLNTSVTSGSLSSPLKVLSAQASVPTGTYTQTLNINMSIPAGTLAGTYTSTVTVTAAAGP